LSFSLDGSAGYEEMMMSNILVLVLIY